MTTKRRDNKNRILRDRETQGADGRYRYSYMENGVRKEIYSWKLEDSDKLPKGKRECVALRTQIKDLERRLFKGLKATRWTVYELAERYTTIKQGVRATTRTGYKTVLKHLKRDPFGNRKISDIKVSDAKIWLIQLQKDGKSYSTIHTIRGVLRPAFQMAVEDEILLKNPFDFQLATVIVNDSVTRDAITRDQERKFLRFVKEDPHFSRYYDGILILFKTGLRISEFCGLTLADIDMVNRTINVDHQLQRISDMTYIIQETKTSAGTRKIPMSDEVFHAFQNILNNRKKSTIEPIIDGKRGFLFLDKNGMPMVALHWEKYLKHICAKYNSIYKVQMPKVTPHVCRHTYCSNMAKSGMNPKTLQYLMGHSDISVTLNTYTHIGFEDAKTEVMNLEKRGNIKAVNSN